MVLCMVEWFFRLMENVLYVILYRKWFYTAPKMVLIKLVYHRRTMCTMVLYRTINTTFLYTYNLKNHVTMQRTI